MTAVLPPVEHTTPEATVSVPPTPDRGQRGRRLAFEWLILIGAALVIALVIKSFLFQAFYIPSESMVPTLNVRDRVLVNKLSYDFHDVNRGDIVVFEAPPEAQTADIKDFVKRVIGLPGETVTFPGDGHVYINGHRLKEPYLPDGVDTCLPASSSCPALDLSDVPTSVPPKGCGAPATNENGCVVPPKHYLMLGDNRENSSDGRTFGVVDEDTIIGRVFVRIWPIGDIGFL